MSNVFDSVNYPTTEPTLALYNRPIVEGDTTPWIKTGYITDYPASEYALKYEALINGSPAHRFDVTGSGASGEWVFSISASDSASLNVGIYQWNLYVTKSATSERIRLEHGEWEVVQNINTDHATDPQSHARKVLSSIEAVIEGRASIDQSSYSIAGRSLSRMSIDELLLFRDRYRAEWLKEKRLERSKKGQGHNGIILTRFTK